MTAIIKCGCHPLNAGDFVGNVGLYFVLLRIVYEMSKPLMDMHKIQIILVYFIKTCLVLHYTVLCVCE